MQTDEALLMQADAGSFTVFFHRHADRVLTHCTRRLNSREDGKDAVSAVFLQTWLKLDKIRFVEGSALPWLLVVATNITSKMLRTQGRERMRLLAAGRPDQPAEFADRVAESVDAHRQIGDAANFIAGLPKRDQLVVSLCDLGGLSHAEAAAVLGISVGTVKSRLFRVHQKLRQALDEHNRPVTSSLEGQLDA